MILRFLAYAFTPGKAPAEIQLWDVGENPTDYGVHRWTSRSEREVLAEYGARGNPLQIDVEHNGAAPPISADDVGPTGGYARLELRAGAPWLVFDWSAFAIEQIESRQRLFLSPEYDVDKQTGEILRLVRVSLVGDPGTHHARMLASARRRVRAGGSTMNLALILAALKAALSAEDPEVSKAQISNLVGEIENMAGGDAGGGGDAGDQAAAAGSQEPAGGQAAAAGDAGAAGGALGAGEDDESRRRAAATDPARCGRGGTAAAVGTADDRIAALEAQLAQECELREAGERVEAAGDRIPGGLRVFARSLSKKQFEQFLKDLPGAGTAAVTGGKVGGVRAAARPSHGTSKPGGTLPDEDRKHMDRVFNTGNRPENSVEELDDGRVRSTHLYRPSQAAGTEG